MAAIELPNVDPFVAPILYAIPVQLLAYHAAVAKGTDVDQPRNLAKSVTVRNGHASRSPALLAAPRLWSQRSDGPA
jgi:hypothetical protein